MPGARAGGALGLGLSVAAVREQRGYARHEGAGHIAAGDHLGGHLTTRQVALLTRFREKALAAACQAGLVNNLNDGLAWGLFPILFARHGLTVSQIGVLAALYPAVWGAGQLGTGALSDMIGRKMADRRRHARPGRRPRADRHRRHVRDMGGRGRAPRRRHRHGYPTLLAAIGDVAHPCGVPGPSACTGSGGIQAAIWIVAALTAASGLILAVRMYETRSQPNDEPA